MYVIEPGLQIMCFWKGPEPNRIETLIQSGGGTEDL